MFVCFLLIRLSFLRIASYSGPGCLLERIYFHTNFSPRHKLDECDIVTFGDYIDPHCQEMELVGVKTSSNLDARP